ncbi:hypothetical protein M3226_02650 [Neobacillus cucumis]|uniref:hypothetical protein n=1 Tax=Neobacillus cucumis TaxID=1740721 RepID=UPI00203F77B2|nr:hypothetical protein [Neobacillus cucumis]MCM3724601.1 hypothetical protein [Neobacillus cucumis]
MVITDATGKPDFEKVTHLPLHQRMEILNAVIPVNTPILSKVMSIDGTASTMANRLIANGL